MEIVCSGLPVYWDESAKRLEFRDGLLCDGSSRKSAADMRGLWRNQEVMQGEDIVYDAYRNIRFQEHEELFQRYDFRYDITVIHPGTVNDEFHKTSGHYHGYIQGEKYPYPEVYEVIKGEVIFVLQKSLNFDRQEEPELKEIKAVRVKEGQAVIIPPFCGHGSVNPTDETVMFSNIAVVSCPMHYAPVIQKGGLAVFLVKDKEKVKIVDNTNYQKGPEAEFVRPGEAAELGIEFGKPCYQNFVHTPDKFDFLLHPELYVNRIDDMLR